MSLHLVDLINNLASAWQRSFAQFPEVSIQHGDLLAAATHCVVSPANSSGFMDGGIDATYRIFFGEQIEETIQAAIARRDEGHLPVGASLVVRTGHERVPYMIVAATMTSPERVEPQNCYRAMRAVLRVAGREKGIGHDVFCPGLATGVGMVPSEEAAAMMAEAYGDWKRANRKKECR